MSKAEKILEKMRQNPRDWRIDDLYAVARAYGVDWRRQGTSHVTFRLPLGNNLRFLRTGQSSQFTSSSSWRSSRQAMENEL